MTRETSPHPSTPSSHVWMSALAGLIGIGCGGGTDHHDPDPMPADAVVVDQAPPIDAPVEPATKIISETPVQLTFAQLKTMCDERGGYIEIHAACSGSNSCAGFSYGDWGADSVLTEHSCAAVSGCNGLGCVVLPKDTDPGFGRSAVDILSEEIPDVEGVAQRSCNYCHAEWNDTGFDATVFKLKLLPGSTRTLANWLDTPAEVQERIIAFGSHGVYPNGVAYSHMAPYHARYSKAEIQRVVQYIRTQATVQIAYIKTEDEVVARQAKTKRRYEIIRRAKAGASL